MTTESQPTKADLWASLESESGDASGQIEARQTIQQQEPTQPPAATSPAQDAGQSGQAGDVFANLDPAVRDTLSGLQTMVGQLTNRLRQAEGHIGGLKSSLQQQIQAAQAVASRGGDAPSRDQLHAATGSASAMARLKEDYPEFAGAMDAALNERLAGAQQAQVPQGLSPEDVEVRIDEMRRQMQVEVKHPGWLDDIKQPRFTGWLQGQAAEVQMLANSVAPSDAIRLLDLYKQTTAGAAAQQASFNAAAALPGRRSSQAPRAVDPNAMTKDEYWAYLDNLDKQKA